MQPSNIDKFFLNTLVKITLLGITIILLTDIFIYPKDHLGLLVDTVILAGAIAAYFLRKKYETIAILILTLPVLIMMFYQCIIIPISTTNSLAVVITIGFVFSVMLKGKLMWLLHIITALSIAAIFIYEVIHPESSFGRPSGAILTIGITYFILYFVISFAAGSLKAEYDNIYKNLIEANEELREKANKIEVQNGELIKVHKDLNDLNKNLEGIVNERTQTLRDRTQQLEQYSYSNAHFLRGPIARLLGLLYVHKLEDRPDTDFFLKEMEDQVNEIDKVVKKINEDLETDDFSNVI
ncbi:MAG: hypothetical protein KDC79_06975 [Cyclobacteriaceae bacterium]|nr:hypothetical protein [Cyclobacteriaceae bacterium]